MADAAGKEAKAEGAPPAAAAPRKKGRFKNKGKKKPQIAELSELDHHPEYIDCFEYFDDEAALLAEEVIGAAVPTGGYYDDLQFTGMDAIYRDFSHPPLGALPADLIQWLRVSRKEVGGIETGVDNPELFPRTSHPDSDEEFEAEEARIDAAEAKAAAEAKGEEAENPEESAAMAKPSHLPDRLDDIVQGQLGNRWLLTALAPLLDHVDVLSRLFVSKRYAAKGLYTIKIFKEGRWRYVHVDDTVPCDMAGIPLFARSANMNAVWVMLLEKAYAKVHGCYERLADGVVEEAMRDFTLGVALAVRVPRPPLNADGEGVPTAFGGDGAGGAPPPSDGVGGVSDEDPTLELWGTLSSILLANKDNRHVLRLKRAEGLAVAVRSAAAAPMKSGRAVDPRRCVMTERGYAVHMLLRIQDPETKSYFRLVMLRNPWGLRSWGGDWCHDDVKWEAHGRVKGLVHSIAPEYGFNPNNGFFIMSWADFCVQFDRVHAVRIAPSDWTLNRFQGEWLADSITDGRGGRPGAPDFAQNPMFGFEYTGGGDPTVMINLSQRDWRWRADEGAALRTSMVEAGGAAGGRLPAVGFVLVKLTGDHLRLHEYWRAKVVASSATASAAGACVRSRDTSNARITLKEGRYAIVPFTYEGGEGGGGNAFYIDMWSDYDFEVFECFQEDAVSEPPSDSEAEEEEEEEGGEEGGGEDGGADGEGKKDAAGEGKSAAAPKTKPAVSKEPDFMVLEPPRVVTENLEELTMMAMQRTMSTLCLNVKNLRGELKELDQQVRKIAAARR